MTWWQIVLLIAVVGAAVEAWHCRLYLAQTCELLRAIQAHLVEVQNVLDREFPVDVFGKPSPRPDRPPRGAA